MAMKDCRTCGKTFDVETGFYHNARGGASPHCKKCYNDRCVERRRKDREKNPEKWQKIWKDKRAKTDPRKQKSYMLKSQFGLTLDEYEQKLVEQDGACAICGITDPGSNRTYFSVDHDHDSGAVRGLLCNNCNAGIGFFADSTERLLSAIRYLSKYGR